MTRILKISTLLSAAALLLVVTAAIAVTQTDQASAGSDTRAEAPSANHGTAADPGETAPAKPADPNVGIPAPKKQCGTCSGTLGHFLENKCPGGCDRKAIGCNNACDSHGGVAIFNCDDNGLYCECNDGTYDSCGCLVP